jgi:hypothetical protein
MGSLRVRVITQAMKFRRIIRVHERHEIWIVLQWTGYSKDYSVGHRDVGAALAAK